MVKALLIAEQATPVEWDGTLPGACRLLRGPVELAEVNLPDGYVMYQIPGSENHIMSEVFQTRLYGRFLLTYEPFRRIAIPRECEFCPVSVPATLAHMMTHPWGSYYETLNDLIESIQAEREESVPTDLPAGDWWKLVRPSAPATPPWPPGCAHSAGQH